MRGLVALCLLGWSVLSFAADKLSVTVDATRPQFTISLPANPTTGFKWVVSKYDTAHFTYLNDDYVATAPVHMGSGGNSVFHFARKSGIKYPCCSQMTFRYARPWDDKSGSTTKVHICFVTKKTNK
jgi:inhibitor of cysteine peptidase